MLQIPKLYGRELLPLCCSCQCGWECMEDWLALSRNSLSAQLNGGGGKSNVYQEEGWYRLHHAWSKGKASTKLGLTHSYSSCLLYRQQGCVLLPFIPGRLHWCQASLWFLLLLHSFSCGLEHLCGSVQKSLLYCKNKSEANPFWLQVFSTHFTFQDLCLSSFFSLSLQHSCQMCVPHCSALETPSAHASYSVAQEEQFSNSVIATIASA